MKALVISDRSEIYNNVTPVLKEKGFDIIHYKWIIKALDNIEEIQPDLIVLSAGEYPRHWKTLAGFVQSGIGGNDVKMYLYETTPLSEEDHKKAADLGILSFEEFETVAEVNEEHLFRNVDIAYNDNSGLLHLASAKYYEDENVIEVNENITNVSYLKSLTMFDENKVVSLTADVENVTDGITRLKVYQI